MNLSMKSHTVCETVRKDHGHALFAFVPLCGLQTWDKNTLIEAPWLMTPLHGAVYEVWNLPSI